MEIKNTENRELVRRALLDGPKSPGEILKWTRSQGIESLDLPLCNLILKRLSESTEAEQFQASTGLCWRATDKMSLDTPMMTDVKGHWSGLGVLLPDLLKLEVGEHLMVDIPQDQPKPKFLVNLRNFLSYRKDTRDHKWSVVQVEGRVRITRGHVAEKQARPPKVPKELAESPTVDQAIKDIDERIAGLLKLKKNLQTYAKERQWL